MFHVPVSVLPRKWGCAGTRLAAALGAVFYLTGGEGLYAATTNFNWIASGTADYSVAVDWDRGTAPNGSINYSAMVTNGGTVNFSTGDTVLIGQLDLAPSNSNRGFFHLTGGSLLISNNNTMIPLFLGGYGSGTSTQPSQGTGSAAVLTVGGGSLTVARNNNSALFNDGVDLGVSTNASGTLTVNNGVVTLLCGMEIGVFGSGTVNLYGGILIDNSWFGIGRGNTGPFGSGLVNITNGTLYLVRNVNTEANNTHGFYFCAAGTNGVANISGGAVYCNRWSFAANASATEVLNISGGNLYVGSDGVSSSTAQPVVTISGGTFHTVDMVTNGTTITLNGNPYVVGNGDTNSILPDGTDWTWTAQPTVILTNSIPGLGGVGYVTFAPESGHMITLNNAWNGSGGFTVNGPGIVEITGSNAYSGDTTILQGILALAGGGAIAGSSNIVVAAGAEFDGPAGGGFTLSGAQTLSNSNSTATLGGTIYTGGGALALNYTPGTPAFDVEGGTLGLSTSTRVVVNNTGPALGAGNYKIISAGATGSVSLPGGLPGVMVSGGGVAGGEYASLGVVGGELFLQVTNDRPPMIVNVVTNNLFYGATWQIAIANLARLAGWSDPDGDPVTLSGVGPMSALGTNVFSDGTNIYYAGPVTADDYFNYTVTDGKLSAVGSVYLNEMNPTAAMPADTNDVVPLNGAWRFYFERTNYNFGAIPNITLPDATQPFQLPNYVEGAGWTNLAVPGGWEMAGLSPATYYGPDDTSGLYRNWVQVPAAWQGRRVYVYFDGVLDGAEVWLNGQPVPVSEPSWNISNYHESGWTGFQVDLTSQVIYGTTNLLAVRVIKSAPANDLDTGDYFVLGGIHRPVTLYSVPQTNLADVQVQTHLLANNSAEVDVTADVTLGNTSTPVAMTLNGVETDTTATNGQAVFKQVISQPRLWSAEFPNLYVLTVSLKDGSGQVTETVTNRIGVREITITNGVVLLNGVPVKFAGVCTHDSSPTNGSAVGRDFWVQDILKMKAANINAIRTTHYPFDSAFYDVCDELGMYVADELPYCWCSSETPLAAWQPAFEQRARETLRRDRNHPSVVIWAIGNENSAGNNLQVAANLVKATDPTRPRLVSTFNATQYGVELSDAHYPSISGMQSDATNAMNSGHPFIFLENPNTWDERLAPDAGMYENWGITLQRVWNVCEQYPTIPGTFPFEWADRAVADPNSNASYTQYKNTGVQLLYYFPATGIHLLKMKGMVDSFRHARPSVYEAQMIYSPVQVSNALTVAAGVVTFPVQNRYSFTDLSYLTTAWQLERAGMTLASGSTNVTLAPLMGGAVTLALPAAALAYADTLRLDFWHPNGDDVLTYRFALTNAAVVSQMGSDLPMALAIPTFNLITRSNYSNPNYWTECARFPVSLTGVVLSPANATNLAGLNALSGTVVGGITGTQVLGTVQAGFTNGVFSYALQWTGPNWDVQELGWAFAMPADYDHFSWNRNARWTAYPASDIGRNAGTATPDSTNVDLTDAPLPNADDFNSTKFNCLWAALTTAGGNGLRLEFALQQPFHCRAGGAGGGTGYVLYANQQVSPPNDLSSSVIPDLYLTLSNGKVVQGSFTVGSNSNLVAYGAGTLNGPINVLFPMGGGLNGNGVELKFGGGTNVSYSVWASTNLSNWVWEGPATAAGPGQYQFVDPGSTNSVERFYRVSVP